MTRRRVVVVSNRLPTTVTVADGKLGITESVGGLATGLRSYLENGADGGKQSRYLWVGWPGSSIPEELRRETVSLLGGERRSYPVFLSHEVIENFYHGFCNKTIWPLFHYFSSLVQYSTETWNHYVGVNRAFCDALGELLREDDLVWIHDYHLMLLPQMLRERFPSLHIGFFLHIPFPNYEIFRLLPGIWRSALLDGMLGADLVAFHTFDYAQDFLRCILRIRGIESTLGRVIMNDRLVRVAAMPMGIHFGRFEDAAGAPEVLAERSALQRPLGDTTIVLSMDRLDYTKGILDRLTGFELFLDESPEFHGKVTLLAVLVPSRIGVDQYDAMKKQIEETVGKINGKFGTTAWTPIVYQFRSLSFQTVVALYVMSDVALVTPLRDGMNLIAKEYLASRRDDTGVLILSEMAGAAKELGEAILINPNDRREIAAAVRQALAMPVEEQRRRNQPMRKRLARTTVVRWAEDFLKFLASARDDDHVYFRKLLGQEARETLIRAYGDARRRLLLLDYDGTLVGFQRKPSAARPGKEVVSLLSALGSDRRNETVIVSGRGRAILEEWFGELPVGLVGEHGAWFKPFSGLWTLPRPLANAWKPTILSLLEGYVDRLPGSSIEEKEFAVAYHYRAADQEHARLAVHELHDELIGFTANIDLQVLRGNKVLEVRAGGVNKGAAAQLWMRNEKYDFILAVGDDWTDEDLFGALPDEAYTLHVGTSPTRARHALRNPSEVLALLRELAVPASVPVAP